MFVCLTFSALQHSFAQTGKLEDGVHADSIKVTMSTENPKLTIKQFVQNLQENDDSFFVLKNTSTTDMKRLSIHNAVFPLAGPKKIDSLPSNAALLSKAYENNIQGHNPPLISAYGKTYEVKKLFSPQETNLFLPASLYIGMNTNASLNGEFIVDGVSKNDLTKVLDTFVDESFQYELSDVRLALKDRLILVVKDQIIVIGVLLLTLILILVNTISTITTWLASREKEITVLFLIGASKAALRYKLLYDYWKIIIASFLAGISLAYFIYLSHVFDILFTDMQWQSIIVSFIFCFIFGTCITWPSILFYTRRYTIYKRGARS